MTYNRSHARPLLTAAEYELFADSLGDRIGGLSAAQLRQRIDRTRRARDKYRNLFRRQSLATRDRTGTKRGRSGAANERTDQKATMFAEALGRFEARLAKLERTEAEAARKATLAKAATTKRKPPAARAAAKKAARKAATRKPTSKAKRPQVGDFQSDGAVGARNKGTISTPRNTKISAHVGARGRRNQAKRDSR